MQSKSHRSHSSSSSSSLKTKVPKTNQQKTVKSFERIWREACVLYSYLLLSSTKWSCRRRCLPFYLCASSMDAADDGEAAVAVPSVPTALNPCFVLTGPWPKCTAVPFWFTPPGLLFVESKGGGGGGRKWSRCEWRILPASQEDSGPCSWIQTLWILRIHEYINSFKDEI